MNILVVRTVLHQGEIEVSFHYDPKLVEKVKNITGRRFDPRSKSWFVPALSIDELKHQFPNEISDEFVETVKAYLSRKPPKPKRHHVSGALYSYQKYGVAFLLENPRCILADEMGLGKTVQTLDACEELLSRKKIDKVIIICPNSVKHPVWEKELKTWLPNAKYVIVGGSKTQRERQWATDATYYVLNYELTINPLDQEKLMELVYNHQCALVLDEATHIKNFRAKRSRAIKRLNTPVRYALTGRPVENRPDELFSINEFLRLPILGTWRQFEFKYIIKNRFNQIIGYKNLDDLHKRVSTIMLRRKKVDVLDDVPDKITQTYEVELTPQESKEYALLTSSVLEWLGTGKFYHQTPRREIFASLTLCRMYLDHPDLIRRSESPRARSVASEITASTSSKFKELIRLLEDEIDPNEKVVIFSQFKTMLDILYNQLTKRERAVMFHGGLSQTERSKALQDFSIRPDIRYFLSTDSGAYGLNLQVASIVIQYDLPWNPAKLQQRIDRLHRIGQKNVVNDIRLVVVDYEKIEQRVKEILGSKDDMFSQVVEGFSADQVWV
jgi:SNF2 family DNA or RNA helicase